MNYIIREMREEEYPLLRDILYEAIFLPEGADPPPRSILDREELTVYIRDFGKMPADKCFLAQADDQIAGAVWVRIMEDYGHIDDETPSFAIALYKQYRGQGIGTALMNKMLRELKKDGFKRASLAVQKKNYAVKMYRRAGFKVVGERDAEYIMVCDLK